MQVWVDNAQRDLIIGAIGAEEVIQNIRLILSTPRGSVPLDRDFGIDWTVIDRPVGEVSQIIKAHIVRQIQKYEPRAKVKKVELLSQELPDGKLRVKVLIEVGEDENS